MAKHNKKRNVGLLHEQLVLLASKKIVEGATEESSKVINIIEKHFKKGSELLREFQLFNAIANTDIAYDSSIAKRIIDESRIACNSHNSEKLELEKSRLIKEINLNLGKDTFYDQKVSTYKVLSTIQALLNEWRGDNNLSPSERIEYEMVLENWLVQNGTKNKKETYLNKSEHANPLVLNIMIDKFNKKYGGKLNNEQLRLLNASLMEDENKVKNIIESIKLKAVNSLNNFYKVEKNEVLCSKKSLIENKINSVKVESSDNSITQALVLSSLIEEIEVKEDER